MRFFRNWKLSLPTAGIAVLGLAWVAFGYFGIQTAFLDDKVAEARPTFDAPAVAEAPIETAPPPESADADAPSEAAPVGDEPAAVEPAPEVPADVPAEETAEVAAEIVTEYSGTFSGTSRYSVSGDALVLGNGSEQRFLRFENFDSSNGPDLNVYLVNPDDPSDFVDLGDLKGNIGEQNYEIPATVDLDRYSQVSIWCVRFGVGFGSADLVPAT